MPIPEDIIARVPQWKEAKDLRFGKPFCKPPIFRRRR
mgnify:CR=1 FL=1